MPTTLIRPAQQQDLPALLAIYNHEILNGVATFDLQPKSLAERQSWFDEHNKNNHPLLVAEQDGEVLGYASLSRYAEKAAYNSTVELSVYIAPSARRQGIASQLMLAVIDLAKKDNATHLIVSLITGTNQASISLHQKFGFNKVGTLHQVGYKHQQFLDVHIYELFV
ncbi:GNAT family N-acetyltransferase [Gallibacterium anatis]|uniref:GNAT family acetyltransferase n=1 Tax=Gallibacterium anatis TaxID=750 RepID=A0A0A2X9Z9_9PAST|nr:GNAT family N-acetyltransferase [Gallibacterium anatis]KGQ27460.1 GNAT family acetyltransferase [Gallibacterium anatis]KGQ37726.1 GNAT family acetyltransferase [Gallibacterium anatis IPDH697-78]KGQ44214.1 GNAT family acetyltransferase [Gallibacterium anatis]KGQ47307.1 GNAT family acetyltransferase [Gallibacterium anatis]KGQ58637.1 GNAT family acetyltransferase [Gallibacterium anatis DSM 16844 = F 149]